MLSILFSTPRLKIDSNINLIVDGNSIYANNTGPTIAATLMSMEPFLSSGCSSVSTAISGQSWYDMAANSSDVDAAYVNGKTNLLVVGETTNSIWHGGGGPVRRAPGAWSDAVNYIQGRKAAHPDLKILLCGSLPMTWPGFPSTGNADMIEWDSLALAGYRAAGASGFASFRTPYTPMYNHDGSQTSYFSAYESNWYDQYVHPNAAGKVVMANAIIKSVKLLTK